MLRIWSGAAQSNLSAALSNILGDKSKAVPVQRLSPRDRGIVLLPHDLECQFDSEHEQYPAKQLTHRLLMLFCMTDSARPRFYRHEDLTAHDIPHYR